MEKYYKHQRKDSTSPSPITNNSPHPNKPSFSLSREKPNAPFSLKVSKEFDVNTLEFDPGLRRKILDFHPNHRDEVRRAYLLKGPCQAIMKEFPLRQVGGAARRFNPNWYKKHVKWLEYSEDKDAIFCLYCYLFKNETRTAAEGDSFVTGGFYSWHKIERCDKHVGGVNNAHNQARRKCEALMNEKNSIQVALYKQSEQVKSEYRTRLVALIDVLRYLLHQGLIFRGHDESETSSNKGNFLELLSWYAKRFDGVSDVTLSNALGNNQSTAPSIQRDIINACVKEITKAIIDDLGD